jgi:uncharacterized protein YozE (UPF0346 family)
MISIYSEILEIRHPKNNKNKTKLQNKTREKEMTIKVTRKQIYYYKEIKDSNKKTE